MARVHFGSFLDLVKKKYQGNGKGPKAAIAATLRDANKTGPAFDSFLPLVKAYALTSAKAEGKALDWKEGREDDANLEASLQSDKGSATKAAAIHFYFLAHNEYAARAEALNQAIDLPGLMTGNFETTVFGFGVSPDAKGEKRMHPIPARPTAPFHWPLYVREEDARARDADVGVWLNPLNHFSIPLAHRKREREVLRKFIDDDRRFLICAVVASSGAGKTRLVSEWMRPFVPEVSDTDWGAGFVTERDPEPWRVWDISRNTLIVIDYTYAYDEVMRAIAERCRYHRGEQAKKVRLIVLDHLYPQLLQDDFFWSQTFSDQREIDSRKKIILFENSPIELHAEKAESAFLREVIAITASSELRKFAPDDDVVVNAERGLSNVSTAAQGYKPEAVRHPLFAALLGQVIRDRSTEHGGWTRRDLIKHYFDKPSRLPWRQDTGGNGWGAWIGIYVAVATIFRGVPFETLEKHLSRASLGGGARFGQRVKFIEQAANRLVSSPDKNALKPLEPDILGESFILHFLNYANRSPDTLSSFLTFLSSHTGDGSREETILNFFEVFQRLSRNLLNDDQSADGVIASWQILDRFLRPKTVQKNSTLRGLFLCIRAEIVRQSKQSRNHPVAVTFSDNIEPDELWRIDAAAIRRTAWVPFIHYFEWALSQENDERASARALANFVREARNGSENGSTALMLASAEGCINAAKVMLQECREEANAINRRGWTALLAAARNGHCDVVEWLVESGAEVDLPRSRSEVSALTIASSCGHTTTVAALLRAGAEIDQGLTDDGWTALMAACQNGHTETAALLLDRGAAIDQGTTDTGWTALMAACQNGHTETAALLLDRGGAIDHGTTDKEWTALLAACQYGHSEAAALLLERGAAVNQSTGDMGFTALMLACSKGDLDMVTLLLDRRADPNQPMKKTGLTALNLTCAKGFSDIATLLLKRGAEVNYDKALMGWTPLMTACQKGNTEMAGLLLDWGAEVDRCTSNNGRTALMIACQAGYVEAVVLLLDRGADINFRRMDTGQTALDHALAHDKLEVAVLLRSFGGRPVGR